MKKNNQILSKLSKKDKELKINSTPKDKMKRKAIINVDDLDNEQQEVYRILETNDYDEQKILEILSDNDYTYYSDADSLEDVAEEEVYDRDLLEILPKDILRTCIDYDKLGGILSANWELCNIEGQKGYVRVY